MTKKFSITWTAPASDGGAAITDYDIGVTPSGGSETVTSHGGTTPPHDVTGLTDGTTYGVRVRAINSQGAGAWSSTVNQLAAVAPDAPTGLASTAVSGGLDLSWTAPAYTGGSAITGYSVRYTPSGGSASTAATGSTGTTYSLTGLTGGTAYDVEVAAITTAGTGPYSSTVTDTPLSGGITPNADNRARFYLPSGATSFSVGAASSTGYIRLTDGTSFGAVGGSSYYAGSHWGYSYQNSASISSLSGSPVIQLFSCDASGSPSGVLYAVNLTGTTQAVDAVDLSGITTLTSFSAYSSAAYTGNFLKYGYGSSSAFPSSITELRAVGVSLGGPTQSAPNSYYAPITYYYSPGVDITDQDLAAAALDQFYSDLGTATTNGQQIIVRLNPGASGDTPSIATAKNYTVYGS